MRRIDGISQKSLTVTLTKLIGLGLVARHSRATVPPHVEYRLTPLGNELRMLIGALDRWVEENWYRMRAEEK